MSEQHDRQELTIFTFFAAVCGLAITLDLIEKREPPNQIFYAASRGGISRFRTG
jgi:hypothetical protein